MREAMSREESSPSMRDPYTVLGVPRSAGEAEIKKAFRRLAKEHHPDRNANDPRAKERFAELNSAYEILGDANKRGQFDRGEIDSSGKPKFQGFEGFGAGPGAGNQSFEFDFGGRKGGQAGPGGFDPSDIFGGMFDDIIRRNAGGGAGARQARAKGEDIEATLMVTLSEIVTGATKRLGLPGGREVDVTIPKAVVEGKVMRLRGLGHPSQLGGAPGDVLLTIKVAPDPRFTVEGRDLRTRIAVPLADAVLGGPVRAPTLAGEVEITLPPMTSSGKSLRLRGKGLPGDAVTPAGDLYVTIDIVLPERDDELTEFMRRRKG